EGRERRRIVARTRLVDEPDRGRLGGVERRERRAERQRRGFAGRRRRGGKPRTDPEQQRRAKAGHGDDREQPGPPQVWRSASRYAPTAMSASGTRKGSNDVGNSEVPVTSRPAATTPSRTAGTSGQRCCGASANATTKPT